MYVSLRGIGSEERVMKVHRVLNLGGSAGKCIKKDTLRTLKWYDAEHQFWARNMINRNFKNESRKALIFVGKFKPHDYR